MHANGVGLLYIRRSSSLLIFLLVGFLVAASGWGAAAFTWSLTAPYPTPLFLREGFQSLDPNFYRPLFIEVLGAATSLLVLLLCLAVFYPGYSRYLISVHGNFRISRLVWGAGFCLVPWLLFFSGEFMRHNGLYLGKSSSHAEVWTLAVAVIAIQTFTEEYIFRGYLLTGVYIASKRYLLSACLSSIAFALVHRPDSLAASVNPFLFGFLCCEFRRISGGIEFSFGYHFMYDAVSQAGILPNFQWYDNNFGIVHFVRQVSGWSIGLLFLGGLLLLLAARFYPGKYCAQSLLRSEGPPDAVPGNDMLPGS